MAALNLRIATRRSPLARAQAALVSDLLISSNPRLTTEFVLLDTIGDREQDRSIEDLGEQGVFSRSVQIAVLDGRADIAVHSFKDLPTAGLEQLCLGAVPPREDSRDALVSCGGRSLAELSAGASVGTSSARRTAQINRLRPDLEIVPLRGNVGTRVARVRPGDLDAAVMAVAGLKRVGMADMIGEVLEPPEFLPAPAQGALAVEVRTDRPEIREAVGLIDDTEARVTTAAERAFLRSLRAGCNAPVAALATLNRSELTLVAAMFEEDASCPEIGVAQAKAADALGRCVAARILSARVARSQ